MAIWHHTWRHDSQTTSTGSRRSQPPTRRRRIDNWQLSWVELSYVTLYTSTTQLNSTRRRVELCRYKRGLRRVTWFFLSFYETCIHYKLPTVCFVSFVKQRSVDTDGHVPTLSRPCWVMGFAQIRIFLFWGEGSRGDGGRTRQQTCVEKHLTAANCSYISGFWRLIPQTLTGAPPLDPAGGLPSSRPSVPTLTSEPGYATVKQ